MLDLADMGGAMPSLYHDHVQVSTAKHEVQFIFIVICLNCKIWKEKSLETNAE